MKRKQRSHTPYYTKRARELFEALCVDCPNWCGNPPVGPEANIPFEPAQMGLLTALKRAGLVTSERMEGMAWVSFTKAGKAEYACIMNREFEWD